MSNHNDILRMRHMLDHAAEAVALSQGRQREDLDTNRILSLALVRLLEIIGEAASRISEASQAQHPTILWAQIVSLRNRLIHGYAAVDMDILWEILTHDLPTLLEALRAIPALEDEL